MITPEQALQLLDHAASAAQGNRADHIQIQQATKVLTQFISDARIKENFVNEEPQQAND